MAGAKCKGKRAGPLSRAPPTGLRACVSTILLAGVSGALLILVGLIYDSPYTANFPACVANAPVLCTSRRLAEAAEERAINDCFSEVEPEIVKSQGIVDYDFQAPTPGIGREVDGKFSVVTQTWSGGDVDMAALLCSDYVQRSDELGIAEVVLVWNGGPDLEDSHIPEVFLSLQRYFATSGLSKRFRTVVAPKNSLMNRYNVSLLEPLITDAVFFTDDDPGRPITRPDIVYKAWREAQGKRVVGVSGRVFEKVADRRSGKSAPPVQLQYSTQSKLLCNGRVMDESAVAAHFAAQTEAEGASKACSYVCNSLCDVFEADMVLPTGMMVHRHVLSSFMHEDLAVLHAFVEQHCVHPDDLALSLYSNLMLLSAPLVVPRERVWGRYDDLLWPEVESVGWGRPKHPKRSFWELVLKLGFRRKTEGLSGHAKDWNRLRSTALQWLFKYLGVVRVEGKWVERTTK